MDARNPGTADLDRLREQADVAQLVERRLPKNTEARSHRHAKYHTIRTTMRVCGNLGELFARVETAVNGADDASRVAGVAS